MSRRLVENPDLESKELQLDLLLPNRYEWDHVMEASESATLFRSEAELILQEVCTHVFVAVTYV